MANVSISVTDPNIYFPGGGTGGGLGFAWINNGTGAACSSAGNYFKFGANVGAAGTVSIQFTNFGDASTILDITVDQGPSTRSNIGSLGTLTLAAGLAAGNHQFIVEIMSSTRGSLWASNQVGMPFNLTGITLSAGGTTIAPVKFADEMWGYGDSRNIGKNELGSGSNDSTVSGIKQLASAWNCELAMDGWSGTGVLQPGFGTPGLYVPGSPSTSRWNLLWAAQARAFPGTPKYVLLHGMGGNDQVAGFTAAQMRAAVSGWLPLLRAQIPKSTWIIWSGCWALSAGNTLKTSVNDGINDYIASTGDPFVKYLENNLAANEQTWVCDTNALAVQTRWSSDGQHQLLAGNQLITTRMARSLQQAMAPASPFVGWHGGFAA